MCTAFDLLLGEGAEPLDLMIQDAEVGVKWVCQRGRLANQSRISLVLWLDALFMTTWMSR